MGVENLEARRFYEIEAVKEHWDVRWLSRQIHSSLYERLALSRDKDAVMKLAKQGQTMEKPTDVLKNPIVLKFLGMEEKASYTETRLESAILDRMQRFLLEMGKGFLFEARQRRFTYDEKSFFVDLVLYNRLLQCYVLVDLKTGELTHQDIGQMQMYVHYYDRRRGGDDLACQREHLCRRIQPVSAGCSPSPAEAPRMDCGRNGGPPGG